MLIHGLVISQAQYLNMALVSVPENHLAGSDVFLGIDFALQCQNAWFSYTSINNDYLRVSGSTGYITSTIRSTTVYEIQ
jgi:hypothetical protein